VRSSKLIVGLHAGACAIVFAVLAACSSTATVDRGSRDAGAAEGPTQSASRSSLPAVAIDANLDPIPERVARSYERALVAMQTENWLEAELELEQLILEEPGFPGPYVNLAIVYAHDGRRDEARTALDTALGIAPGFAPASNQLGLLLRLEGKFAEAEQAYGRAIQSDPSYALAHINLGILLDLYLNRPADALVQYSLYQQSLAEPDATVARWIVDLERRTGASAARVAQD
jgi:tetratricopeptide (TPR) repeat protein